MMRKIIIQLATLLILSHTVYGQTKITYTYDKEGKLKNETIGKDFAVNYSYDAEGNLIAKFIGSATNIDETLNDPKSSIIDVFPNPAENFLFINTSAQAERITIISIYNYAGQLVMQRNIPVNADDNLIKLDVCMLRNGLYLLVLTREGYIDAIKFEKR